MPELRDDLPTGSMHLIDDTLPAPQSFFAIEARNVRISTLAAG